MQEWTVRCWPERKVKRLNHFKRNCMPFYWNCELGKSDCKVWISFNGGPTVQKYTKSLIHPSIHPSIGSFVRSFVRSFIHSFVYLLTDWSVQNLKLTAFIWLTRHCAFHAYVWNVTHNHNQSVGCPLLLERYRDKKTFVNKLENHILCKASLLLCYNCLLSESN